MRKLPVGVYIAIIACGIMLILDGFNIAKAPVFAYIVCIIAGVFFLTEKKKRV